jgi:Na+-transporting methylmalonyl-CoA/oxaloacetate decarboxylase gamma subunit
MLLVAFLAAVIWGIGAAMGVPRAARLNMLGLLFVAVLAVQVALPHGHPVREATGGSPALWLILGGFVVLVLAYRAVLTRLRGRAERIEAEREEVAPPEDGPFSGAELERYARHITLPDIGGAGQLALKRAKVLVVGAGGLGSPVLLYLAAAGVGRIGVIDGDTSRCRICSGR